MLGARQASAASTANDFNMRTPLPYACVPYFQRTIDSWRTLVALRGIKSEFRRLLRTEADHLMTDVDIRIRNARLRHGHSSPVDITIADGLIAAIGPSLEATARAEVDAGGNLVTE